MKYITLLYLIFNVLAYTFNMELRTAQEFFFQVSTIFLILSALVFDRKGKMSKQEVKFNITLFSLFAWLILVYVFNSMGWSILFNVFLGMGAYLTISRSMDKDDILFVVRHSLWITAFTILYLMSQFLGYDMRGYTLRNSGSLIPKCSLFGLEAHYGLYLAMMFPLLLGISFINRDLGQKRTKILKIASILAFISLLFLALVPAHSTGAYLGLLAAVLVYLWHKVRLVFWVALLPVFIGAALFLSKVDNPMGMQNTRFDMWGKAIQDAHKRPFGYGLDSFRNDDREGAVKYFKYAWNDHTVRVKKTGVDWILQETPPPEFFERMKKVSPMDFWDNPHNEYVQIFYEAGFPGLILTGFLGYFLWQVFKFSRRNPLTVATFASLVSIAIFSCVQFPFHVARIGHAIPIILGMFIVSARDE